MAEAGQPLTPEALNQVYRALNAQYYKGAVVDPLQDMEWARIPHFYNAFYVYQYATGFSAAVAIANKIRQTGGRVGISRLLADRRQRLPHPGAEAGRGGSEQAGYGWKRRWMYLQRA